MFWGRNKNACSSYDRSKRSQFSPNIFLGEEKHARSSYDRPKKISGYQGWVSGHQGLAFGYQGQVSGYEHLAFGTPDPRIL